MQHLLKRACGGAKTPAVVLFAIVLAACSTPMPKDTGRSGQDGGPAAGSRPDLDKVPDAVPKAEAILPAGPNKQYVANGVTYLPDISNRPFQQRGLASWYGEKFHGNRTASGEVYDMYAMSAAHTTLPLPSYARVTHLGNGKSVVVRVNDRGPFAGGRVIDLSYAAAHKLGMVQAGQAEVLVERVFASDAAVSPFPTTATSATNTGNSSTASAASIPAPAPAPATTVAAAPGAQNTQTASAPPLSTERPRNIAPPTGKGLTLQAGAFSLGANAQKMAMQLRSALPDLADRINVEMAMVKGKNLFRVMVGSFSSEAERSSAAARVEKVTGSPAGLR
jgi:rare lipoprotein A